MLNSVDKNDHYDKMLKWLILTYVMIFLAIEFNVFVSEVVIAF